MSAQSREGQSLKDNLTGMGRKQSTEQTRQHTHTRTKPHAHTHFLPDLLWAGRAPGMQPEALIVHVSQGILLA